MLTSVASLTIFVYGLMSALLGALLPSYSLTTAEQGSLGLINALGLVVASLSVGPLVDWKGKKLGLVLGLSLISLALLAAPHAVRYAPLLAVYFGLGLGGGAVSTSTNALVGDLASERRGSALNFVNLFFGLGGVLTTFAASYLMIPPTLCYSIAVLAALALLMALRAPIVGPSGRVRFNPNQVPELMANPTLLALCALMFLYVACEVGVWNWLKIYLISIHFTPQNAGGVVSYGFAFGILLGRMAVSRLLLKTPPLRVIAVSSVLIAITTFVMLQLHSPSCVTIAVFCSGLSMASVFPTALSMVGDQFPGTMATAMGLAITSGWLGLAASSPLIGAIAGKFSVGDALLLLPAFATAMVLVTLVLYTRLQKAAWT